MIDFTVLIPHKNQPGLLQKAIDSIPHWDNVQIIVVDDNSDQALVDFVHFPGLNDRNVEVIFTKEGKGAGYARNIGLPKVKGKWITFLGADDFFHPCISEVMSDIKDTPYDVVFFKDDSRKLDDNTKSSRADGYNARIDIALTTGDFTQALLYSCDARKFYNVDFLFRNNILFDECRWGNDVVFMGRVAANATKYKALDLYAYCSTESPGSLTQSNSLESKIVRLKEECKNVKILRPKFGKEETIYYWLFDSWMRVWKASKIKGFARGIQSHGTIFRILTYHLGWNMLMTI